MQDYSSQTQITLFRYGLAVTGIFLVTISLAAFRENLSTATVALSFLVVVLFTATFLGRNPALLASFAGMLCFNFFFLQPIYTWTISEPQNLVAWAAFTITAVVAGQLSGYARQRAEEAERRKGEMERLYNKLQEAFEQASQAEALRQSEKLKSALLDAVTHDLRTPLTSIKASVTTLLDNNKNTEFRLDDEGKQEFLEIINEEADRLNSFIEGMVELARLEAGAMSLRRNWSGIEEIIGAALERTKAMLQNHRLKLEIERELPSVRVDAKALAEVIYTLVDNAAKYSPPQSQIKITVRRGSGETVEIAVIDEGRGVPMEMRVKVFDKFFRAGLDDKEKQAVGGLGLGLAIARGIVESHGGRIWIEDGERERGTTIKFTVPIGDEER